jgi:AmmeMemoRadiSam system protein A
MSSPDRAPGLSVGERRQLVAIARAAIAAGRVAPVVAPDTAQLPPALAAPGASFVSLHRPDGALRGCIGSLEAHRPLAVDVAANARAAAFEDPRFPPVAAGEAPALVLEISVLQPSVPLPAASEEELLAALRPGVDGLVLVEGLRRATFLPAVWRQLPEPRDFLAHLKRKAGLPPDYWSPTLRFLRYTVDEIR